MEAIDNISRSISEFFNAYAPVNVTCALDYYYDLDKNEIAWSFLTSSDRGDELFVNFFENELGCPTLNCFLYSILHEFGHRMTLTEDMLQEHQVFMKQIADEESGDELQLKYMRMPVELVASQYAVEFAKAHYDEIADWYDDVLLPQLQALTQSPDMQAMMQLLLEGETE